MVGTSKHDLGRNCQAMYELGIASGMLLSALLNLLLQAIGGCFTHWSFPLRGSMWLKVKTLQKIIWWMPPSRRRNQTTLVNSSPFGIIMFFHFVSLFEPPLEIHTSILTGFEDPTEATILWYQCDFC